MGVIFVLEILIILEKFSICIIDSSVTTKTLHIGTVLIVLFGWVWNIPQFFRWI